MEAKSRRSDDASGDVETVMEAAQMLVALSARSVASVENVVTLPQLRVLVMVFDSGGMNLSALANGIGVHPSNATRLVERLVVAGLMNRRDNPADRRTLVLTLTLAGRDLVNRVINLRRAAIAEILDRMPAVHRRALASELRSFAAAGREVFDNADWHLTWTNAS